jgi:methanogenic corrinoid protein MtbC1
MTMYRYVRTGRVPATKEAGTWWIETDALAALDLAAPRRRASTAAGPTRQVPALMARLVAGDEPGAWTLVEQMLASGATPEGVLLDVLGPALCVIGDRWEAETLRVADEHRASAVASRLIARLGARFSPAGRRRGTVVVAAPGGEWHGIPVSMGANVLRWRGYDVVELGATSPVDALADAVGGASAPLAVALACTGDASLRAVRRSVTAVHAAAPLVPVLVGGRAVRDAAHARSFGADAWSGRRADDLVSAVEGLARG